MSASTKGGAAGAQARRVAREFNKLKPAPLNDPAPTPAKNPLGDSAPVLGSLGRRK